MSHEHVSYLELLARGAATEAYDRPVLLARASGAGPEALAELEEAKQLALRVRAELEGRRRREAELSALFATAHDLAGLRDLDAVLRAIVQRARSLLGTECAYLSLNDPVAGDTYMRVTEGSVSARFQQVRLGMGEGLGGLVAQTARPYVTDDYFGDARFQHTRTIDTAVRDEGLVAILGVPLSLGSQVIGVLFAADRRARVFEREQVALLCSFAAHAAVAIDTANLLAETRSALAELERANDIIREHSGVIERASEVHDRLSELVLHGGGVHDVAHAVSEVLGGTVEFTDEGAGAARRVGGHAVREGDDWVAAVSMRRRDPGRPRAARPAGPRPGRPTHPGTRRTRHLPPAARPPPASTRPNSGYGANSSTTSSTPPTGTGDCSGSAQPGSVPTAKPRTWCSPPGSTAPAAADTGADAAWTRERRPAASLVGGHPSGGHPSRTRLRPRRRNGPAAAPGPRRERRGPRPGDREDPGRHTAGTGHRGRLRPRTGAPRPPGPGGRRVRGGAPLPRRAPDAAPLGPGRRRRGPRLPGPAARRQQGHRRLRRPDRRPGRRLRPTPGDRPGAHPGRLFRERDEPGPDEGRTPRPRQHGGPAPGTGRLTLGPDWQSPSRALEIQLALRLHALADAVTAT